MSPASNESAPMAKLARLCKGGILLFLAADHFSSDFFGQGRASGHRITIAEPFRQVAVAAARGTERGMLLAARLLADRAGAILASHVARFGQRPFRWQGPGQSLSSSDDLFGAPAP